MSARSRYFNTKVIIVVALAAGILSAVLVASSVFQARVQQHMIGHMMADNTQFQQDGMHPSMMQNWRIGTGMGPGMMGGHMIGSRVNTNTAPAVNTDQVSITGGPSDPGSATPYLPMHIEVQKGTTVTWTNKDSVVHTVTDINNGFDSRLIKPGDNWSYTFNTGGEFDYFCSIHPWMRGTVEVK